MADSCRIINARLLQQDREIQGAEVIVDQGIITSIGPPKASTDTPPLPTVDLAGQWLAAAPIEIHIHGAGTFGFETDTPDILENGVRFLLDCGIGWVMPTLAFSEPPLRRIAAELDAKPWLRRFVPGIYLEGPFINPKKRGGIQPEMIEPPNPERLEQILDMGRGFVRMMTFAPEIPGTAELVPILRRHGVIPCLGHSLASAAESVAALDGEPFNTTHLFNAMSGLSHKDIGMAALPFLEKEVYFELNGDRVHVTPEMLQLCSTALSPARRILITDAVISAGLTYGNYHYFGHTVESGTNGVRYTQSGTLIGSNRLIFDVIRNMQALTSEPLFQLWNSVTTVPSKLLQMPEIGAIQLNQPARMVAFDNDFRVTHKWGFV
jgi:N-acetylglucosamine-6-phosphate deacetylase